MRNRLDRMMENHSFDKWPVNLNNTDMSFEKIQDVYIANTATVLGELTLGENVNIWYGASVRGDVAPISIGSCTNVQDNAVIHCDHTVANTIGSDVTIGHSAILHGIEVGDGSLIGMSATLLGGSRVGKRCLIAAGAVVPPGMVVPDDSVVMGVPGKIVRQTTDQEKSYLLKLPRHYLKLVRQHVESPHDPTVRPWDGNQSERTCD